MYNFSFNITDYLEEIPAGFWILGIFFLIVVVLGLIAIYIISSLGIMNVASKNKIPNAWLAFVPYARYYIIGKLGFEIYPEEGKKNPTLTWVLFGLSCGVLVLSSQDYSYLLRAAVTVFNAIAFYNIFKVLAPKSATGFTIGTVIVENLGGIFLYAVRNNVPESKVDEAVVLEAQEEKPKVEPVLNEEEKPKLKPKKVDTTEESKERPNFCPNCGGKISKTAKFCGNCGKEIK